MRRVHEQDNNANRYLVWLFQMVSRLKQIYKWCLDQLTSDILQVVLMKIENVQEMFFIDKTNKWIHDRKLFQVVSHFYTWYQSYKTVVPQVILNFKWSSSEESSLTYKSSSLSSEWPMLGHRGRSPTIIGIKVTRSYTWCLKELYKWCPSKMKMQVSTIYPNASLCINKKHTFYRNW